MSDSKKLEQIADTVCKIDKDVALQKAALESHTAQDEKMYEELRRMNDILQSNTESLKEHMGNNKLLKDMIGKMDERLSPLEIDYLEKKAVRKWLIESSKFIVKVGTAVGLVVGVWMYGLPFLAHLLK